MNKIHHCFAQLYSFQNAVNNSVMKKVYLTGYFAKPL